MPRPFSFVLPCALAAALIAGCGGSSSSSGAAAPSPTAASAGSASGALSADAHSAATGDIPDNQAFLVFHNATDGYAVKYPEGWTQTGSGPNVTFRDKNNLVHIQVARRSAPSIAAVASQLAALKQTTPTLSFTTPSTVTLQGRKAIRAVYRTQSPPNPVTGKRVTLIVDRYVLAGSGRVATVDLGTPQGVDNVDAYRMMIESFRWN